MGAKHRHSRRHAKGRGAVRQRWHRHDRKAEREANNAIFETHKSVKADGLEGIDHDEIGATAPHDTTETGGEKS